jgi:hypothetical protein
MRFWGVFVVFKRRPHLRRTARPGLDEDGASHSGEELLTATPTCHVAIRRRVLRYLFIPMFFSELGCLRKTTELLSHFFLLNRLPGPVGVA